MPPTLAFILPAFLLGLLIGSFLNVCISRLPSGESIISPRSRCPGCANPIASYDNIPLLSFALLRGRCRHCRQPIPWRYPAVELATGLWFALVASLTLRPSLAGLYVQQTSGSFALLLLTAVSLATLGSLLIALLVIDWQHHILPDALTLTGIFLSFLITCTQAIFLPESQNEVHLHRANPLTSPGNVVDRGNLLLTGPEAILGHWLLSTVAAALILLVVRWTYRLLRRREGMGLGDVKLLAMIAAFLGLWPSVLALFLGVFLATLYAVYLLATRRASALTALPLGAFLAAGGLLAALIGSPVVAWYKSLL